jgi:hypothetical protein
MDSTNIASFSFDTPGKLGTVRFKNKYRRRNKNKKSKTLSKKKKKSHTLMIRFPLLAINIEKHNRTPFVGPLDSFGNLSLRNAFIISHFATIKMSQRELRD